MTNYIGTPPEAWVIPVTKGTDRQFTLSRKDSDDDPVNWGASLYIDIDIDKDSPTRVTASVASDVATFRLESTVCDLVKNSTKWRVVMSTAGSPSFEVPIVVGTFERHDG
jgi:hypothetical protein